MEAIAYLDTHVVAWLYGAEQDRLSREATLVIQQAESLRISPIVRLELQYLFEIGRVSEAPIRVLDEMSAFLGLTICSAEFSAIVHEAERQSWTRDPFDRIIVAQAKLHRAPLVTKDAEIRQHYAGAVW